MDDFKDLGDLQPPPRVAPAAWLWTMFVVIVLAMSGLVWMNPDADMKARALPDQRCWPQCAPADAEQAVDDVPPATAATVKPSVKPGNPPSV